MKLLRTSLASAAAFCWLAAATFALPVYKVFRVTDTGGNPVGGATVAVGGTTLTAGTAASVSGKNLDTGAAITSQSVTYQDYNDGTGEYVISYDPATQEGHFVVTVSKAATTISNPTFAVDFYNDPSLLLLTNTRVIAAIPATAAGAIGGLPLSKNTSGQVELTPNDHAVNANQDVPAGIVQALLINVPASGTTSGTAESLSFVQFFALQLSLMAGGTTNQAPAASGTATTTYYLLGKPKTSAYIVAVSTASFDANRTISGRSLLISQPFPAVP